MSTHYAKWFHVSVSQPKRSAKSADLKANAASVLLTGRQTDSVVSAVNSSS